MRKTILPLLLLTLCIASAKQPDHPLPPGTAKDGQAINEAYLFSHMTKEDYGRLYYSVSLDGLHWEQLNGGKRVFDEYKGHPDITQGHDGRFYLVGNKSDSVTTINIWVSDDLIHWKHHANYTPNLQDTPGYEEALDRVGAPKLYYDPSTKQYLLSWHTPHLWGTDGDAERYWRSQRTLYVTSKDLKTFSKTPRRLFGWDIATIDVFVRKINGTYYAVLKDETYPTLEWVTGKTIRICSSQSLTGPYSYPTAPISPNFREAPMLIPSPDGTCWYMYYEQYPGISYGLSIARNPDGPWYQISGNTHFADWDKYSVPPALRHGAMMPITKVRYDQLVEHFGKSAD